MTLSGCADVAETHISVLFFVGDRAYKLKKPVRFGFLDFSTPALRADACRREVALNRRIAPDVYLGVGEFHDPERADDEPVVVMRRMPADRRLSMLVADGVDVDDELRRLARLVASFHARTATSHTIATAGSAEALRDRWESTFRELQPYVGRVVDAELAEHVQTEARRYIAGRDRLFRRRQDEGRIRDAHGDLRADDVFCLPDGPRVLDCIEFDDRLRYVDTLDDVCFLAMDLERLGRPELAARFLVWWREFSGETYPETLAAHYIAYRAMVRCKVACLRTSQGDLEAVSEARALLRLADRHLERGRVRLVLVGGLPGTGKSTLAHGLGRELGWTVIRSDVRRKELAGVALGAHHAEAFRTGLYDPEATSLTYTDLLGDAQEALRLGESVVLDASWTDARWRQKARVVAHAADSDLVELRCTAPEIVARQRLLERSSEDPSDADPGVARAMADRFDQWPEAVEIPTCRERESTLRRALKAVST